MILNLYIFKYVFDKQNGKKLRNSLLISLAIYIISIYISIITKTSSTTYIEGIGYKGWIESGNSVSSILVLGTFIIMSFILNIKNKIAKVLTFCILMLIGVYLVTLIGTRVGLIGFVLAILCFIISQIFERIVNKVKINTKNIIIFLIVLIMLIMLVIFAGSITFKRRNHLQNMESTIIDETTGEISHITGDLTNLKNKISKNEIEENFMTKEQQQSIIELYNIANKNNISNTNRRVQQLIYNCALIKNQKNIILILFGNGYLINTNELVLEMEFIAILLNFGIIGFLLYMAPFVLIFVKALMTLFRKFKFLDTEFIMLFCTITLSFVLSTLSGYTFFNSSSMIIIIIANILLDNKIKQIKE